MAGVVGTAIEGSVGAATGGSVSGAGAGVAGAVTGDSDTVEGERIWLPAPRIGKLFWSIGAPVRASKNFVLGSRLVRS